MKRGGTDGLEARFDALIRERELSWTRNGKRIRVEFGGTARSQDVTFTVADGAIVLQSRILGRGEVTRNDRWWRDLARRAWLRNARKNLVTFGFDRRDRLIGRIEHPFATLDDDELVLAVQALAKECDRFEYLLTGRDRE